MGSTMGAFLKSIILGFIAGAIATVTIHELINLAILHYWTDFPRQPWAMDPVSVTVGQTTLAEVPRFARDAFWGGIWGIIFALILGSVPKGSMTLKGLILGLLGPGVFGALIIVPAITGGEPFLGGNQNVIAGTLLMAAGFGAVAAWLYGFFTAGCRLP